MSVVHDPTFRQRLRFTRKPDGDGGEVLFVEIWIDPGGGVTPHVHPSVDERFRVVAGTAQFLAGRSWQSAGSGEEVLVPAGRRHAYRNRGDQVAYITCDVTPPSTVQEFLEGIAAMSSAGMLTRQGLPKTPRAFVQAGALAWEHRDMLVLGFPPLPPWSVQRLVLPLLARIHNKEEKHHASDR